MEGAHKALEIDSKRAIDMGTRLHFKIHERGEGAVKPGRHRFVQNFGLEERTMDFINRFAGGKKY